MVQSLIDDLIGCKECDQWFDNLQPLNCCNSKICLNCKHYCDDNATGSNLSSSTSSTVIAPQSPLPSIDKSIEHLYTSFLSVNSCYSIGLGTSFDNDSDNDGDEYNETFEHIVLPTDTIQGLSIKYGCLIDELKSINKLNNSIGSSGSITKSILLIPSKPNQTRQQPYEVLSNKDIVDILKKNLITKFIKKSKCTDNQKVELYLEKHSYDFFKALVDYNNNKQIEIQQQQSQSQQQPPQLDRQQQREEVFKYQEFTFGSSPSETPTLGNQNSNNNSNNVNNSINNDDNNNNNENNNRNLLNNSDFLIKSYREKYSDIPKSTKLHNINKPSIRKAQRACCAFF